MAAGQKRVVSKQKRPREEEEEEEKGVKKKATTFNNPNTIPLGGKKTNDKKNNKKNKNNKQKQDKNDNNPTSVTSLVPSSSLPASEQLTFFLNRFQSANGLKLSSLELESFKDTCILELSQDLDQDAGVLSTHMKDAFGTSWKEELVEGKLLEGTVDPGNPAILVISASAIRSLELLRGLRSLTVDCRAAKLFAKHMKVEDQVSMLKSRVNIASGTPSRIKKLIDMDALGLSRLSVIVMDMHTDAKGYSLLTLPQVSDEFWDLYKSHFHHLMVQGDLRICLYGPISCASDKKSAVTHDE